MDRPVVIGVEQDPERDRTLLSWSTTSKRSALPGLFDIPLGATPELVRAAVELGRAQVEGARGTHSRVIAQLHGEMATELAADARFATRVRQ